MHNKIIKNNKKPMHYLAQVILVMAAYILLGLFGKALSVFPSHAAIIWPSAGVALAATLLLGLRIWPAIFLGNFCLSAWSFDFDSSYLLVYFACGSGAVANVLMGKYLIQRYIGFPNALIESKDILQFLMLGGPISCLLSATIAMTSLQFSGILAVPEIAINWLSWWVGDTIGVLIFTPLTLIAFAQPQYFWRQRRSSVAYPILFTLTLVIIFFVYAGHQELNRQKQSFDNITDNLTQALNNRIQHHYLNLISLQSFFLYSQEVEENEFTLFTEQALTQFTDLDALAWVNKEQIDGAITPNITFINNKLPKHRKLPGQDQTTTLEKLLLDPIHAYQDNKTANFFSRYTNNYLFIYLPVFKKTEPNKHVTEVYQGMLASTIAISQLLTEAFKGLNQTDIEIKILDQLQADATIYSSKPDSSDPRLEPFSNKVSIPIGDQQWRIIYQSRPGLINTGEFWNVWLVLISGLVFTCLLGAGLMLITGQYFRIENIVNERTDALRGEIQERELIEQDLTKAINKAEAANVAKSQFLRNMSHELRTPLNGILGFTQLLENNTQLSADVTDKVNIIKHCGENLLTLINDILDISKIESEKIEITSKPFDFIAFIDNMFEIFELSAKEKNISFILSTETLPATVISDEKRLRQIIMNLLSNAIKFTQQGTVTLSIAFAKDTLNLSVQDTGFGIAKKDHESIFKPFVQISHDGETELGTGLGLTITSKLVTLMGGKLNLKSKPGQGSIFAIQLPLLERVQKLPSPDKKQEVIGYQGTIRYILIVDDNIENLEFLNTFLQKIGFNVATVTSGKDCLQFCSNITPDIIFMDMLMPEMSGIKTIKEIRQLYSPEIKIIGMSASVFASEKQAFVQAGCFNFVAKPIQQVQLLACIEDAIKLRWINTSPDSKQTQHTPAYVLIADDNEINCLLLKNMLENLGCTSIAVTNGKLALNELQKHAFDLALIDINMPVMGGLEMIQQVPKLTLTHNKPVFVAISAFVDEQTINATLHAGFDNYLSKPVDANQLKNLLHSIEVKHYED